MQLHTEFWDKNECPDKKGVLISVINYHVICTAMGYRLFQGVHIDSRVGSQTRIGSIPRSFIVKILFLYKIIYN